MRTQAAPEKATHLNHRVPISMTTILLEVKYRSQYLRG